MLFSLYYSTFSDYETILSFRLALSSSVGYAEENISNNVLFFSATQFSCLNWMFPVVIDHCPKTTKNWTPCAHLCSHISLSFMFNFLLSLANYVSSWMVEPRRIELLTSCVQSRRSPSWAMAPSWWVWEDLNFWPHPYQGCALTNWATDPSRSLLSKIVCASVLSPVI